MALRVCARARVVTVSEIGELPFTGHASLVCDVIALHGSLEMSRRKFPSGRKKWIFFDAPANKPHNRDGTSACVQLLRV